MMRGLLTLRGALAKRGRVQAMKRVSDEYLDSMLTRP